jgi:hypothetical protein
VGASVRGAIAPEISADFQPVSRAVVKVCYCGGLAQSQESTSCSPTLEIKSVESGFIGGIVTHKNVDGAYLQVKVAGDIIPQYLVDIDNDGKAEWIDKDQLTSERFKQLVVKEERLLIRLKRFRALDVRSANNTYQWHQNREYRLRLIDGQLSGSVGIPPKNYGDGSGTTEQGVMTLRKL